jgi:ribonuclease HII
MLIAGIDEAGRGPLAGPVVAAAVILPAEGDFIIELKDSKKLKPPKREQLCAEINLKAQVGIGIVAHRIIDDINILQASLLAMRKALHNLPTLPDLAQLDGNQLLPNYPRRQEAVIKGDQLIPAISAASIVAKVVRDQLMRRLDNIFPGYGFSKHKGYPTRLHYECIKKQGICPIHRKTFLKRRDGF